MPNGLALNRLFTSEKFMIDENGGVIMRKFLILMVIFLLVPNICLASLVMHFSFNGSCKNSVNGISGIHFGNHNYGKGLLNNAIYFDGDGDYIDLGTGYNLSKNFTMNVWVKTDVDNIKREDAAILAKYETNEYGPYDFYLSYNCPAYWISDGKGNYQKHISNTKLSPNQWYMLTYTYDYAKSQLTIYINGKYDTSFKCIPVTSNKDKVTIGRQALMFGDYSRLQYKGWIDELRLYDQTLSYESIKNLYRKYLMYSNM